MSPLEFFRDATPACIDVSGGVPQFDTYVVSSYRALAGQRLSTTLQGCADCFANPKSCALEQAVCYCGGTLQAQAPVTALAMALKGQSIGSLSSDTQNCVRVRALVRGSVSAAPAARVCECDPEWLKPNPNSVCALSAPLVPSALPYTLRVQCPADASHGLCEP
ncbi:MAG: hypothetical protein SF187_20320 [Deltaproteobacteria bacterium]|nr:hypothetical protein [Deltaproteobacteria bacterium]